MGKKEKLKERILSAPSDLSWPELTSFLDSLGYKQVKNKKTGGSRRRFFKEKTGGVITMHEPHGSSSVKKGAIKQTLENLKDAGEI